MDLEARECTAERVEVDYQTAPLFSTVIAPGAADGEHRHGALAVRTGEVTVTQEFAGYRVRRYGETLAVLPLDLPPLSFETTGCWWVFPPALPGALTAAGLDPAGALHAAEHALIACLPIHLLCDRADLGGFSTLRFSSAGSRRTAAPRSASTTAAPAAPASRGLRPRSCPRSPPPRGRWSRTARARRVPVLHLLAQVRQRQPAPRQGGRGGRARRAAPAVNNPISPDRLCYRDDRGLPRDGRLSRRAPGPAGRSDGDRGGGPARRARPDHPGRDPGRERPRGPGRGPARDHGGRGPHPRARDRDVARGGRAPDRRRLRRAPLRRDHARGDPGPRDPDRDGAPDRGGGRGPDRGDRQGRARPERRRERVPEGLLCRPHPVGRRDRAGPLGPGRRLRPAGARDQPLPPAPRGDRALCRGDPAGTTRS